METDEVSVLIETGNQFSIHQTRLSEASPNGLSFPKKNTSFIQSKLQNPPQKNATMFPAPPSKQTKKMQQNPISTNKVSFFFFQLRVTVVL